jgi:hypothetical protein
MPRRALCLCGCGLEMPSDTSPVPHHAYFESPTRFTVEGTEQRARDRGASIEIAPPDVLQIDIDGPEAYDRFSEQLEIYQNCETLPALGKIVERASRTEGHKHITIELPTEYTIEQRIMLQALLGSDLKRELLSLASHHNGHENPIVFYRPQEESNAATSPRSRDRSDSDGRTSNGNARDRLAAVVRRRGAAADGELRGRSFTSAFLDDLTDGAEITF